MCVKMIPYGVGAHIHRIPNNMKAQTVQLDTGNFSIIVSGMPTDEQVEKFTKFGMTYDLQRTPATKAYLALSGVPGKKAGTLTFPKGFERDSVPFSADNAAVMQKSVAAHFATKLVDCKVVVVEHVKEEAADGRQRARSIYAKWSAEGKLDAKLAVIDYEGDVTDAEEVVEAIHAYLISPAK